MSNFATPIAHYATTLPTTWSWIPLLLRTLASLTHQAKLHWYWTRVLWGLPRLPLLGRLGWLLLLSFEEGGISTLCKLFSLS